MQQFCWFFKTGHGVPTWGVSFSRDMFEDTYVYWYKHKSIEFHYLYRFGTFEIPTKGLGWFLFQKPGSAYIEDVIRNVIGENKHNIDAFGIFKYPYIYIYICSPPPGAIHEVFFWPDSSFSYCKLFPITIHFFFFFLPFFLKRSVVFLTKIFTIIQFCLNQIPTWLQPFVLEIGRRKCKFKYHLCRWHLLQRINPFFIKEGVVY